MSRRISELRAAPLDVALREPFGIATSSLTRIENVLVTVVLENGVLGHGEAAPWPELTGETRSTVFATLEAAREVVVGRDPRAYRTISEELARRFSGQTSARAGLEVAVFDALTRDLGIPLYQFFGGRCSELVSDLTIPIVPAGRARERAAEIARDGFRVIKVKVGQDMDEDLDRILAIHEAAPGVELLVDANQGYTPAGALRFLARLERAGIVPRLIEQPVGRHDIEGLRRVRESTTVPVAADESVRDRYDALAIVRAGAADVLNIKLMKCGGFVEALEIVAIARAAGLGLMIGGMVETRLGMGAAAHLAAGVGGFGDVDLDTHLLLVDDPFAGVFVQEGPRMTLREDWPGTGAAVRDGPAGIPASRQAGEAAP